MGFNRTEILPCRKKCPPRTKHQSGRETAEICVLLDNRMAVNDDPRMAVHLVVHPVKPNHEHWISANAREHAVEQQAALKAVTVGHAHYLAQSNDARHQLPFGFAIARTCRGTPRPMR